jgi:hypothetical protein
VVNAYEPWFTLSGYANSENSLYWSTEDRRAVMSACTQFENQSVVRDCARRIIGQISFEEIINSRRYIR